MTIISFEEQPPKLRQTDYRKTEALMPAPPDPRENILSCLARNLPEFQPGLLPHDGTMIVVGSGPSLPDFIDEIRAEREKRRPIFAVKGAHDVLCEAGIEPDLFMSVEAKPKLENVKHKNKRTTYILSSRCAPELFDYLSDCSVIVVHSYDDKTQKLPEMVGKTVVGGGTTSGMRAVTVAYLLGFSKQILYGFDSCLSADKRKRCYDTGSFQDHQIIDRWVANRQFFCNGAMAMQADEFQEYFKMLPDLLLQLKGDGLLAAIMSERKRLGLSGVLNP